MLQYMGQEHLQWEHQDAAGGRNSPVMKRNNPPSFVQLRTQLCTAGVKCAVNAVPLGKIWSVKQEEYQLLWRETEMMRPGC